MLTANSAGTNWIFSKKLKLFGKKIPEVKKIKGDQGE